MKKVLLASTVLAMTATVAAAEGVTVTGSARMGVEYNELAANEMQFTSRVRVNFAMSGETDGGLAFGASFNSHDSGGANAGTAGSVFISGAFGKLSMGDVSGAAEKVVGDVSGVGLTGIGDHNENLYLSNFNALARSAALYEYTVGGLTFALSADNPEFDGLTAVPGLRGVEDVYSVGVKYSTGDYAFSLGYESMNIETAPAVMTSVDHIIVGAEATFGAVNVKATYGEASSNAAGIAALGLAGPGVAGATDLSQAAISATYSMDALSLTAFHRQVDFGAPGKGRFTGIGASYDLGGGASVVGGLVDVNLPGAAADNTRADLGLSFKF